MQPENKDNSLEALIEIRSIMDRSARFISLSGWSGIWAGCTALAGAAVSYKWLHEPGYRYANRIESESGSLFDPRTLNFIYLAAVIIAVAIAGGVFFTFRKTKRLGHTLWNNASKQMILQLSFPLLAGGTFALAFLYYGVGFLVVPGCLIFYGLALISASRYTVSDIRYLGIFDVALGFASLLLPGYGLYFWGAGFGVLHILYGAIMWNKYDK